MATFDISLSSSKRPQFPPRCVTCELEHPTSSAKISVTGAGQTPSFIETALGGGSTASNNVSVNMEVPSCPKCGKALQWRHFWKTFWLYVGALGGVVLFALVFMATKSLWLGLFLLFAGILAPVIWEMVSPPAFTITPMGGTITYEFRSELCAKEFQALNVPAEPETPAAETPAAEASAAETPA